MGQTPPIRGLTGHLRALNDCGCVACDSGGVKLGEICCGRRIMAILDVKIRDLMCKMAKIQ